MKGQSSDQLRWTAWNSRWPRSIRGLTGSLIRRVPPSDIAGIAAAANAASGVGVRGDSVRNQTPVVRSPTRASKESSPGAVRRLVIS